MLRVAFSLNMIESALDWDRCKPELLHVLWNLEKQKDCCCPLFFGSAIVRKTIH